MIISIKHRGLRDLYQNGNSRYVDPRHVRRLSLILTTLDGCTSSQGMNLSGFRFHALSGPMRGHYAVWVSANWRVTFRFEDGNACDVDYVDYH